MATRQTVLVTGGARGIGQGIVQAFLSHDFLASDQARYMTGSLVTVDGGSLAGRNQLPRS